MTDASQLDDDLEVLGLSSRSEGVRAALRLLHRAARHAAIARDYDDFYGAGLVPMGDVAALGAHIAAEVMTAADPAD